jgi:formylglycine-generating enzyme required for sulfatase activity/sugar lactone lactonase YvrE
MGGDGTFGSVLEFRVARNDSLQGTTLALDGGGNVTLGAGEIPFSKWIQVVLVNPENSGINDPQLWVDGIQMQIRNWNDPDWIYDTQGTQSLTIGGAPDNLRFFEGSIDDVRIYNRALSASEVQALYASEATVQFTVQPQSQLVNQGQAATLSVTASGVGSLSYQWQKDGMDIPGAVSSSFSLSSAQPWHIGDYTVKVTDSVGTVTSEVATLSLNGVNSGIWKALVGYFPFNGNTKDQTSFGNDATKIGGALLGVDRFGTPNQSMALPGGGDYLTAPGIPKLAGKSFTISAYTLRTRDDTFGSIFDQGDESYASNARISAGFRPGYATPWPANCATFGFYDNDLDSSANSSSLNVWENWTFTYSVETGFRAIYKNGALLVSDLSPPAQPSVGGAFFGTFNNAAWAFFGSLDDIRIYNRALSTFEVQALYTSEATISPILSSPSSTQISATTATLGGNVTSDGGAAITERGVVYSATTTNADPLLDGTGVTKLTATGTTGVFSMPVTGLTQNTNYSFKVYAINSQGTSYTSVGAFTTLSNNADLSALMLSSGTLSPSFASDTTAYSAGVSNSMSSITVTPSQTQANATIEVRVNSGTYAEVTSASEALALNVGINTVDVRVTAQDGVTQKAYSVTVTRAAINPSYLNGSEVPVTSDAYTATGNTLGTVTLGAAAAPGQVFTLVNNTGASPIIGTFTGLAEGATFSATFGGDTFIFRISYVGGDGNDITLTRVGGEGQIGNSSHVYDWSLIAGKHGEAGSADGVGMNARFSAPSGVTVDSTGNLFVVDGDNHTIRKITVTGSVSTFAGTLGIRGSTDGMGTAARFDAPFGITCDSSDNLYVADQGNSCIRRISPQGDVSTVTASVGQLSWGPQGVAVDLQGNLYITDTNGQRICKISPQTGFSVLAGGGAGQAGSADGTGTAARFSSPSGITVDTNGNVYVADHGNHLLRKISPAGVVTTLAGSPGQANSVDGVGSAARLYYPTGISVDPSGDLFLCGFDGSVRRISPSGVVTTVGGLAQQGGTTNGVGSVARFISSFGVACGRYGELYVVEWLYGHVVRKGAPMGFKPLVSLEAATVAGVVTLHGTVNPNGFVTNAMFEYGKTQTLGNEVALSLGSNASTSSQAVSAQLSLLESGSTYYYRLTASNVDGSTLSDLGTFTTLSTNPDLSALTLSSGTLSPAFASVTTDYTAGVSGAATSITMTPTAAQANATMEVRVNGGTYAAVASGSPSASLALNVGINTVDIRVTAQDGVTQKIYSVTVTRANPIQNLVVAQRSGTRLIDLTYDLDAAAPVKITLEISSDGGQTYFVPAYALTGDVGLNVAAGNGKTMTWDAGTDWLGNRSDQMRFRLVADDLSDGFSYIPEGPFTMGRTSGDTDSNAPPVSVKVSRFEIQTTETTKAQWDTVRAWAVNNGYTDLQVGAGKATNHPVQTVNWLNAVKWCNALSQMEGLTPVYVIGANIMRTGSLVPEAKWSANGYRLPTEAEWEKSARGGFKGLRFPWGNTISHNNANYSANSLNINYDTSGYTENTSHPDYNDGVMPYTSPVGSFSVNGYGLFDMAGNVMEWCWDWYNQSNYIDGAIDPRGLDSGTDKVFRSGRWSQNAGPCRASSRNWVAINYQNTISGFRLARNYAGTNDYIVNENTIIDSRADQFILFGEIPDKVTTDLVNLTATGGDSGNPVTFAVTSGPGVITNNVLTFTTSGSVTITTSQAGNDNYLAAPDVIRTFNVTKAMATVTLGSLAQTFNNTPRAATASTEPVGLSVEFTYAGSPTPPTNAGSYEVVGTVNDLIYQGTATGTLVIGKASQEVTFAAISDKLTTDSVNLAATGGGSNTPVTFAVTSGPGVISNNVLTFTTSGSVTITASQAGNDNFLAASEVSRTFNVTKAAATVTLGSLAQTFNNTPRIATATTTPADLNVEFTYAGSTTPPTNAGSYEVIGTINDLIYQGSANGTLEIGKATQVITFATIADKLTTDSVTLAATGGDSNNPVTFAVTSGPGVITNNVLTFTTSGSVTITASQAGNDNYLAAPDVSRTFNVTKTMATVTLGSVVQTFNNTPRVTTATTTPADLSVEFTYAGSTTPPTNAGSYEVVGTINDLIYQGSASGTLVIGKASQEVTFAVIADKLTTDSVNLAATGGGSNNPVTFAVTSGPAVITNNVLTFTTSGSVTITASQVGNDNYLAAPDVIRTFNVTKAMATVTLGSLAQTFNNTPRAATSSTEPVGLTVEFAYEGSSTPPTDAGTYAVVGMISDPIYQGSVTGMLEIGKAAQAISFAAIPEKLTIDSVNLNATGGSSANAVTFALTSGPGVITNNVLTFTTSGSVTITASQIGNDNYLAAPDVIRTFNVTKAMATITLGSLAQTFNNTPRVATATTEPSGKTVIFTYEGSSTAPTNAGSYEVVGAINDPIYQGSATGTLVIGKAAQSITFAAITDKLTTDSVNLAATGGGSNNPVTFAVTSGPAVITNNVLTFTTSGSVTITASQVGNDNYLAAPEVSRMFNVTKAMATITLGSLAQTFNNTPLAATATTAPLGLVVQFTYDGSSSAPTVAGTYVVVGTINDPMYQGSATGSLVIGKAAQSITFAAITDKLTTNSINLSATGGGSNNPVTFAVTSGPGVITNNVLTFTTSGSVTVKASQSGNDNYVVAPDVSRTFNVTKAAATVTLGSLAQTFSNTARIATATTTPADLNVEFTYAGSTTPPTNAGSYEVVGTINDPIYLGSAAGTLVIGKDSQTITFAVIPDKLTTDSVNLAATGGGSNNPVTFAVTSGPGVITNNVLTFTTSGSITITASQSGNDNYVAAPEVSRTFNVTKATATVTLGSLSQTFNNTPRVATATTAPSGLVVQFTYDGSSSAPTVAGTYAVVGTINDAMYQGSANGSLVIGKASQAITFAAIPDKLTTDSVNLSATGGGSNNPVTFAVTSGPGLITNNVLTFTTSGSVTVTGSQSGNANYLAAPEVSRTFNVTKAIAAVTLGSLAQTFNNTPRLASANTEPNPLAVGLTYNGSSTAPTNAGSYEVVATVNDLIYQGSATGTLVIGKESQTIAFAAIADKLTTDSVNLSASGGGSNTPVTFAVTSGPGVITNNVLTFTTSGSVTITASQVGNDNYLAAPDVIRTFNVTKTMATVTLGSLAQTFDNTPRAATASTDPLGLSVEFTYAGSSTAPTNAGSYEVIGTINDPIYQGSATGTLVIGKESQTIAFAAITDKLTTDSVNLTATGGGSNNPVTFAVTSGPGVPSPTMF